MMKRLLVCIFAAALCACATLQSPIYSNAEAGDALVNTWDVTPWDGVPEATWTGP
jgi:hypothetical protein